MPTVEVITRIQAPIDLCFDLARDVGFHVQTMEHTGERAVGGRTEGLLELGETVTWEGRHFGVRQRLTSRITEFNRPTHFRDEMQRGAFKRLSHDHSFVAEGTTVVMTDRLDFASPFGTLGWLVDYLVMRRYLRRLIADRAARLAEEAERRAVV